MPKSKQSNIKTRVARRKPHDDPALDSKQKATFLSKDNKKQPVHTPPSDSSVSSTIAKDKKNTENMLASLVPPRHIEGTSLFPHTHTWMHSPFVFLVHQEGRTTVDKKLRAFDLDYKYGPCVGLSRLQRWGT